MVCFRSLRRLVISDSRGSNEEGGNSEAIVEGNLGISRLNRQIDKTGKLSSETEEPR